ncbi:hypothetical protein [Microbacterium sp. SZ1]|nr:hypothetical protein [Microbacterium sp. SZ1]
MNRRSTYQPARGIRRVTYREHVAAALGAASGMLAISLLVIGMAVTR